MSKYHAKKTGGYASRKESVRAFELAVLVKIGEIRDLEQQVRFELIPRQFCGDKLQEREVSYVADFVYRERDGGKKIVEDVKGFRTPEYIIKRKLMLQRWGIVIREV